MILKVLIFCFFMVCVLIVSGGSKLPQVVFTCFSVSICSGPVGCSSCFGLFLAVFGCLR